MARHAWSAATSRGFTVSGEVRRDRAARSREPCERCVEMERDAAALENLPDVAGDVLVERGEDFSVLADDRHLGAEIAERARHLQTDDSRAHDDEARRKDGEEEDLVRRNRRVDARYVRNDRCGSRADDDPVAPQGRAVHGDRVRITEPRLAKDDLGAGARERRR